MTEQTSLSAGCRPRGTAGTLIPSDRDGLSSQSIDSTANHCKAIENLRGYILFLEEMNKKYVPDQPLQADRELQARRVIDAAFSERVQSPLEGS